MRSRGRARQRGVHLGRVVLLAIALVPLSACGSQAHGFCAKHSCIANFSNGSGYVVQCQDGMWSHSGGRPGACSGHGGER